MTDRRDNEMRSDEVELGVQEAEAQLRYSAVRGERRRRQRAGGGPTAMPPTAGGAGGNTAASTGATAAAPTSGAGAPPATLAGSDAMMGAAVGAGTAATVAVTDVHFDNGQLVAQGAQLSDDPWGAYDNPENIPGLDLDEQERHGESRDSMALRGSGTRGREKGGRGGAPMMPMGGAAGGSAGAGGQSAVAAAGQSSGQSLPSAAASAQAGSVRAAGSSTGGASAGGAAVLPGASVAGVGGAQNSLLQQQLAAQHSAASGAQQGSLSLAQISALQQTRATGAMFSPYPSGVMAADGTAQGFPADEALAESLLRAGRNTTDPTVVGSDGNIYANPYHRDPSSGLQWSPTGTPTAGVHGPTGGMQDIFGRTNGPVGGSSSMPGTAGSPTSSITTDGARSAVQQTNSTSYSGGTPGGAPGQASAVSGGGFHSGPTASVNRLTGHGTARGTDYSVLDGELTKEAKEWDAIARDQQRLRDKFNTLPDPRPIFGVLEQVVPSYESVRNQSVASTEQRTAQNEYTSVNLHITDTAYSRNEVEGAAQSDKEIPR